MHSAVDLTPNGDGFALEDELPKTLEFTLDPPLVLNEKTYDTMSLQEPTAFQVESAEMEIGNQASFSAMRRYQIKLVANVSGWPVEVVRRMPISQMLRGFNYLRDFIAAGQETGASL